MKTESPLTVGALARLAGVTVRTLHHYDEIGLVSPAEHTDAGYRLYRRAEIERLQEVLFFRELGFGLAEIRRIIGDPEYRRDQALARHREMLLARADRLLGMVDLIDKVIDSYEKGTEMSTEEMLEVFEGFDPADFEAEAEERWGGTGAYEESSRRTRNYTKEDWELLKTEARAIDERLLALMAGGIEADSIEAMDLAESHRAHISKWFYECTPEIHAGLGKMYVSDHRFTANIDKTAEGLAEYLSEAIAANFVRSGSAPTA